MAATQLRSNEQFIDICQVIRNEIYLVHNNVMQSPSKEVIKNAISRIESCMQRLSSFQSTLSEAALEDLQSYLALTQVP